MVIVMKLIAKGLEMSVNFNISVKADKVSTHNKSVVDNTTTFNDEIYEGVNASAGFNFNMKADSCDEDIDLKYFGEIMTNLVNKSVSEVKEKIEEQKTTEESYSDDIDGDEIANLMC